MDISVNNICPVKQSGQVSERTEAVHNPHEGSFLSAAKKIFSVFSPAPAGNAEKPAASGFKKIKETASHDKEESEEDILRDIEKLLRRIERSRKAGKGA